MVILLDTNLLLRYVEPGHDQHEPTWKSVEYHRAIGNEIRVVPQNLYEFWTVATRPTDVNGLGLTPAQAADEIRTIKTSFGFDNDHHTLCTEWQQLVETHGCLGKAAYDARLVAAMKTLGIDAVLTFNTSDFKRYPDIIVLDPRIEAHKNISSALETE